MAEQVDAQDLKSCGLRNPCQFDSDSGHHFLSKVGKNKKMQKNLQKHIDITKCIVVDCYGVLIKSDAKHDF